MPGGAEGLVDALGLEVHLIAAQVQLAG